jgi:hypothetical protein
VVLVCDVGGGTSDFSVIRVSREGDLVNFTRTAVGKHLLLGGDNLDLTLTWLVETKLGVPLSVRQRSGLRRQCSNAKERLLTDPNLKSVEITVLGSGSSLIGRSLKTEILREELLELALDGFLPFSQRGEAPKEEKRSLFRELGLPYVTDPAITRHLNAFLESANQAPDAILFNGGFFIPTILQGGVRKSSKTASSIWRWRAARRITRTCGPPAAACWCAEGCRALTMSGSARRAKGSFRRFAWCRAAPRKARPSKSITTRSSSSPIGRYRSACIVRSRAPKTNSATWWNSRRTIPICTCTHP